MSVEGIATIVTALGAGGILLKLIEAVIQRVLGKQKREQDAWSQRDKEAQARRRLEEYASDLRILLRDRGVDRADIPDWPDYRTTQD